MDIQPVSGLTPNVAAPGGATPDASITKLAQPHGVSRESLIEFVQSKIQQARQDGGQPPLDQAALDQLVDHALDRNSGQSAGRDQSGTDEPASASYTSAAQPTASTGGKSGTISMLA